MTVPGVEGAADTQKQYGVLSWCFVKALEELRYQCTYYELVDAITQQMQKIKEEYLPRMDQEVLMTFAAPLSKPRTMKALQPLDGMAQADRGISGMGQSMQVAGPSVVPPPQPGQIPSSGSTAPRQASEDLPPQPQPNGARLPQRSTSELVHHNVEGREGGSFMVQGTSAEPSPNRYAVPTREPSHNAPPREPSRTYSRQDELIQNRQLPAPPPPVGRSASNAGQVLPPPPPPMPPSRSPSAGHGGSWAPPPVSASALPKQAAYPGQLAPASPANSGQAAYPGQPAPPPAVAPGMGLTPPDLFGGAGPPSLSFSIPGYGNIDQSQARQGQRQQPQTRMPFSAPLYGR